MDQPGGLDSPVQFLKGIGPRRAEQLARIGVKTVRDLLLLVPRRYLDRSQLKSIRELRPGDEVTVIVRVVATGSRRLRNFRQVLTCLVRDDSGEMEAVWFNRPDLKDRFHANEEVLLSGQVTAYRRKQFVNPAFETMDDSGEFPFEKTIIPIYPLTEGLSIWTIRRAVRAALDSYCAEFTETLLPEIREHYDYPEIGAALERMHFPKELESALRSRERMIYDELFYFELLLALRRREYSDARKGRPLAETGRLTGSFLAGLPFRLTPGQQGALAEIKADMAAERCMGRLLQGDVGSGKTVVALYAMLIACENGCQAAMMAPTEILTEQHFRGWRERLESIGVRAALLTGSTRAAERAETLAGVASGEIKVLMGTHALIEEAVQFSRLGLVVVDEQHRFGVMQRSALLNKGLNPDFLVMTATPIPRTLTMTIYGDLDVSVIADKPAGRKQVVTRLATERQRQQIYEATGRRLDAGEQAFVVCPLIEESEKLDLASAVKTFELTKAAFPRHRVALVHGRMPADERNEAMDGFRGGDVDVMVATSVIEVGVDVPNATVMLIEHPERFGLAQLHQLRGRIGRSSKQSYCVLLVGRAATGGVSDRLRFFAENSDGFRLAERDLELRGPGELLGTRQHGLPDLRVADIVRDREILARARRDAFRLVELDPKLAQQQNELLRDTLRRRHAGRAELVRVG